MYRESVGLKDGPGFAGLKCAGHFGPLSALVCGENSGPNGTN